MGIRYEPERANLPSSNGIYFVHPCRFRPAPPRFMHPFKAHLGHALGATSTARPPLRFQAWLFIQQDDGLLDGPAEACMPTRMASGAPTPRNDIWAGCKRMHAVNTVRVKCVHYRCQGTTSGQAASLRQSGCMQRTQCDRCLVRLHRDRAHACVDAQSASVWVPMIEDHALTFRSILLRASLPAYVYVYTSDMGDQIRERRIKSPQHPPRRT